MSAGRWLTVPEAAAYLRVTVRHFRARILPTLPASDLASPGATRRRLRVHTDDLDTWMRGQRVSRVA